MVPPPRLALRRRDAAVCANGGHSALQGAHEGGQFLSSRKIVANDHICGQNGIVYEAARSRKARVLK